MHVNHISLCAGLAGIDLGLRRVVQNLRTVAYVEIEAFCVANLVAKMEARRLDSAPVYTDLNRFPFREFAGTVDLVSGGFPCTPFSNAGSRKGVEDDRHLWPIIARGVDALRPGCVFFENVDGIASAASPGHHSVLHHVLEDLEGMGFRATAGCFTASEVGAPHRRRRWFILGVADRDRGTCGSRESRRADREVPLASPGLRRGEVEGQARQESRGGGANGVADASDTVRRSGVGSTEEGARKDRERGGRPDFGSSGVADADCGGGGEDSKFSELREQGVEQPPCDRRGTDATERGEVAAEGVADGDEQGLEGLAWDVLRAGGTWVRGASGPAPADGLSRWPSPPGCEQQGWEPPRTTEPGLRGVPHGIRVRTRVDRLRALGNSVVHRCVSVAFSRLWWELHE